MSIHAWGEVHRNHRECECRISGVSPRVQSHIIILHDHVMETVCFSLPHIIYMQLVQGKCSFLHVYVQVRVIQSAGVERKD